MNLLKDRHKFSTTITQVNSSTRVHGMSIGRLFKIIGKRSHYVLSFITFLPLLLPIQILPGFSFILSIPVLFITLQILCGADIIWLPKFITRIRINQLFVRKVDKISKRYIFLVENLTNKRLVFLSSKKIKKIHNVVLFLSAFGASIPIPFVCMVPAFAGVLLSAGLAIGDGLLIIFGWLFSFVGWSLIVVTIKTLLIFKQYIPLI